MKNNSSGPQESTKHSKLPNVNNWNPSKRETWFKEKMIEENIAENFPYLIESLKQQVQKAQQIL